MNNAWRLAKKDLLVTLRDKVVMAVTFLLPIALATVFGSAMGAIGGGGGGSPRVTVLVEDRDDSEASRALVEALEASAAIRVRRVDLTDDDPEESARGRVAKGDEPAGLLIPTGFAAGEVEGGGLGLVLYRDPGASLEQQVLATALVPALIDGVGEEFVRDAAERALDLMPIPDASRAAARLVFRETWDRFEGLVDPGLDASGEPETEDDEEAFVLDAGGLDTLMESVLGIEVVDVVGGDDAKEAERVAIAAQAVAGIAVMMLLFGLVGAGGTLLDEEASGTLDRLRLAPGAGRAILSGKFLFCWILGLIQIVILLVYSSFVFDLPVLASVGPLALHSAAVAAAATGFGVLFAVVCRNRKQLEGISTLVILAMSAFGGAWWPLSMTPEWYQDLADFTLTAWAMKGYQAIFWYQQGWAGVFLPVAILVGIALVTGAVASVLWRRRVQGI